MTSSTTHFTPPESSASPTASFYDLSDDEEGEYNTIMHSHSGRGVKLLFSKSKVCRTLSAQKAIRAIYRFDAIPSHLHAHSKANNRVTGLCASDTVFQRQRTGLYRSHSAEAVSRRTTRTADILIIFEECQSLLISLGLAARSILGGRVRCLRQSRPLRILLTTPPKIPGTAAAHHYDSYQRHRQLCLCHPCQRNIFSSDQAAKPRLVVWKRRD